MLDLNCSCSGFLPIAVIPVVAHVNVLAAPDADTVSTHGRKSCAQKLQGVLAEADLTLAELELGRLMLSTAPKMMLSIRQDLGKA